MNFFRTPYHMFDKQVTENISYVIRQCVAFNCPLSLRGVSQFDGNNIYKFECSSLPNIGMLDLFSHYFDSISIDVDKEHVFIRLTIDSNKGIPF